MKLYKKKYPDEKPLKVVLMSEGWNEQWEAKWSDSAKKVIWTKYKNLDSVAISAEKKVDGKKTCYVHFLQAYRVWNGKSYGPINVLEPLGYMPYEILKKHAK